MGWKKRRNGVEQFFISITQKCYFRATR